MMRVEAIGALLVVSAGCTSAPDRETSAAGVNVTPDDSEVWVRTQMTPGEDGVAAGSVKVHRDSTGYVIDSDVVVVTPGDGAVTATVEGPDAAFVLYAYSFRADRPYDLADPAGPPGDGWTRVTYRPALGKIEGEGAEGNQDLWSGTGTKTYTWISRPPRPYGIAFVAVPRYRFWTEIEGDLPYRVHVACTDSAGQATACGSLAPPGTSTWIQPAHAWGKEPNPRGRGGPRDDWFWNNEQRLEGGFCLRVLGHRVEIHAHQGAVHYPRLDGSVLVDSTSWRFDGVLETVGPPLEAVTSSGPFTRSEDGRRVEFTFPWDRNEGVVSFDLTGHDDEPTPRLRAHLTLDGDAADSDNVFVGDQCDRESDDDGDEITIVPRP